MIENNNYNISSNKRCYIDVSKQKRSHLVKKDKPKQRVLIRVK